MKTWTEATMLIMIPTVDVKYHSAYECMNMQQNRRVTHMPVVTRKDFAAPLIISLTFLLKSASVQP